jgi:hypothetical protein
MEVLGQTLLCDFAARVCWLFVLKAATAGAEKLGVEVKDLD